MDYHIYQEVELINFKIDGEVTPYASIANQNIFTGKAENTRTISIQLNESGTYDVTVFKF